MEIQTALKIIVEGSGQLVAWALAIAAGSVAAIVSTSYIRPENKLFRLVYLLFLPGWLFLGLSVYYGDQVSRSYMASLLVDKNAVRTIAQAMNTEIVCQRNMFGLALLFFTLWLVLFLCWWIFGKWSVSSSRQIGG